MDNSLTYKIKLTLLQDKVDERFRNARHNMHYFSDLLEVDKKFENLFEKLKMNPSGKEVFFTSELAEKKNDISSVGISWEYEDFIFQSIFPFEEFQVFFTNQEGKFKIFPFPKDDNDIERILRGLSKWVIN